MSNIDDMPAGRELDALVAERVMGFVRVTDDTSDYNHVRHGNEVLLPPGATLHSLQEWLPRKGQIPFGYFVTQRYSTDIAAAWRVWSLPQHKGWLLEQGGDCQTVYEGWRDMEDGIWLASADTAPLAICRAALKALEAA